MCLLGVRRLALLRRLLGLVVCGSLCRALLVQHLPHSIGKAIALLFHRVSLAQRTSPCRYVGCLARAASRACHGLCAPHAGAQCGNGDQRRAHAQDAVAKANKAHMAREGIDLSWRMWSEPSHRRRVSSRLRRLPSDHDAINRELTCGAFVSHHLRPHNLTSRQQSLAVAPI